jgi:hypothetical protein
MGDIIEIESRAHANARGRRNDPTTSASVDADNSILITHCRPHCRSFERRVTVIANATTLVLVIVARNTHDLRP